MTNIDWFWAALGHAIYDDKSYYGVNMIKSMTDVINTEMLEICILN